MITKKIDLSTIKNREKENWFDLLLQLRSSVILAIWPRVAVCGAFTFLICLLHNLNFPVALPSLSLVVPSLVLGLLLVFRTNTAYERFWEGRKLWGITTNTVRNFARTIWVVIEEKSDEDVISKRKGIYLLLAFVIATKLHLRNEAIEHNDEIKDLITPERLNKLRLMNNPPLEIAFWIGDYLEEEHKRERIDTYHLNALFKYLDTLVDVLGGCERILKTPIPLAYSIHLKQLLMLYCLTLPFQVIKEANWWSIIIVSLISFAVFGIEEIGIEIENPFGYDANDLPLDNMCKNMKRNLEDLMTLEPHVRKKNRISYYN